MKRFYEHAEPVEVDGGWQVALDGRGIKTQGGKAQVVPSKTLATALANEWRDQGEKLDPSRFIFRDHADVAIDLIAADRDAAIDKLIGYAETDTLCYRADPEDALFQRQQEAWEPLLGHLEDRHGIKFQRVSGVMHRPQPPETLAKLRSHLETLDDFTLGGLTAMASLAASLSVALLAMDDAINDPLALWQDASLEEEWQADLWGRDELAEERRRKRTEDFLAAATFVALAQARD